MGASTTLPWSCKACVSENYVGHVHHMYRGTCPLLSPYLYIIRFGVDFLGELGQGVLWFQDEVVGIVLVVDTTDDVQNDCTQHTGAGL